MNDRANCTSLICRDWQKESPDIAHLADVLGHDLIGHRALTILAKNGYRSVEAVRRLSEDDVADYSGAGRSIVQRVQERIFESPGGQSWTIERIEAALAGDPLTVDFQVEVRRTPVHALTKVALRWQRVAEEKLAAAGTEATE